MTRFLSRSVAVASMVATAGCASLGPTDFVNITTSQSLVSNCQQVGEISVDQSTRDNAVLGALDSAARHKGANFVLLKADGARSGVAYRCAMPSSQTPSGS